MFTPTITNVLKQDGKAHVSVSFTDGVATVVRQYSVGTLSELKSRIRSDKEQMEQFELDTITNGVIDVTVTPVVPTQAELDKIQWFKDWNNLQGANKLIAAGVIADTLPAYISLKANVVSGFKNSYATLL